MGSSPEKKKMGESNSWHKSLFTSQSSPAKDYMYFTNGQYHRAAENHHKPSSATTIGGLPRYHHKPLDHQSHKSNDNRGSNRTVVNNSYKSFGISNHPGGHKSSNSGHHHHKSPSGGSQNSQRSSGSGGRHHHHPKSSGNPDHHKTSSPGSHKSSSSGGQKSNGSGGGQKSPVSSLHPANKMAAMEGYAPPTTQQSERQEPDIQQLQWPWPGTNNSADSDPSGIHLSIGNKSQNSSGSRKSQGERNNNNNGNNAEQTSKSQSNNKKSSSPSSHKDNKKEKDKSKTQILKIQTNQGSIKIPVKVQKSLALSEAGKAKLLAIRGSTGATDFPILPLPSGRKSNPFFFPWESVEGAVGSKSLIFPSQMLANKIMIGRTKSITFDRSRSLKAQVERAIKEHKVYTIFGLFPAIRRSLNRRGWVEKNPTASSVRNSYTIQSLDRGYDEESDQAWIQRVLKDHVPDFVWTYRRENIIWHDLTYGQIVNRHPKAVFTSKVGIASCLQNMHWFCENGVAYTSFPRCYRMALDEEKAAFTNDFRFTACLSLLKWVVGAFETKGEDGVMDQDSKIPSLCVDFAIHQVNNYVRIRRHEDLDWLTMPSFSAQNWDVFITHYYAIVMYKMKISLDENGVPAKTKYELARRALQRVAPFWPQLNIDGINNVWICKPGARSRGSGIILLNNLDKIIQQITYFHTGNMKEANNWVVQKYIERPLLVYGTKFDIRQWFLVSDWSPLTVWFYKECYLRFCSKPFSIENFHESIHLCNNAVQCRYKNSDQRDSALPHDNMWDSYTFQAYLKSIGKWDMWHSVISPGMKQGILGVILAAQEHAVVRKNCFELYGADFLLAEDFVPWLIEINSSPCMAATTSVTSRMCWKCLDDCLKVTVDRRNNKTANTGLFELIYKQNHTPKPVPATELGKEVQLVGKKLMKDVDWPGILTKYQSKRDELGKESSRLLKNLDRSSVISEGITFTDLVQRLKLKDVGQKKSGGNADDGSYLITPDVGTPGTPPTPKMSAARSLITQKSGNSHLSENPGPPHAKKQKAKSANQEMQ